MNCPYCKTHNKDPNAMFCTKCGKEIGTMNPNPDFGNISKKYVGPKKLVRSRSNRVVAGVCGGLEEYYGYDAWLLRIGFIFLTILGFSGAFLYMIMIILIPENQLDPWSE